jgi:hypothetical protein
VFTANPQRKEVTMMTTAKSIKINGILGSLFIVLSIGLSISAAGEYNSKDQEIGHDGHCIAYACGVVYDTKTGLEWVVGPDKDTNWDEAKPWVDSLTVAGGGWRMPTIVELKTLFEKDRGSRNMTPLLKTTGTWIWSGETKDSSLAWRFFFTDGYRHCGSRDFSYLGRAFAVRPLK